MQRRVVDSESTGESDMNASLNSSFPKRSVLEIVHVDSFALNDLGNESNRRRGGRHLRQIEELHCTPDGQYAIMRCSDNAVVLYR